MESYVPLFAKGVELRLQASAKRTPERRSRAMAESNGRKTKLGRQGHVHCALYCSQPKVELLKLQALILCSITVHSIFRTSNFHLTSLEIFKLTFSCRISTVKTGPKPFDCFDLKSKFPQIRLEKLPSEWFQPYRALLDKPRAAVALDAAVLTVLFKVDVLSLKGDETEF